MSPSRIERCFDLVKLIACLLVETDKSIATLFSNMTLNHSPFIPVDMQ